MDFRCHVPVHCWGHCACGDCTRREQQRTDGAETHRLECTQPVVLITLPPSLYNNACKNCPSSPQQVYRLPVPLLPSTTTTSAPIGTGAAATCAADPNCAFQVQWNTVLQAMFIVHIFGLLWITGFIKVACATNHNSNHGSRTNPHAGCRYCDGQWSSHTSILEPSSAALCHPACCCGVLPLVLVSSNNVS